MDDPEWFNAYKNKVGKVVNLSGTTSTSKKLDIALKFSQCAKEFDSIPGKSVLFVFLIQNYIWNYGFRLTKGEYSVFPYEQEYLIAEGKEVMVLKVEENMVLKINQQEMEAQYNDQTVNVIYLYDDGCLY